MTDGVAALEYFEGNLLAGRQGPELILLDINMPRMCGFEFLEHYAKFPDDMRQRQMIVMLSTSSLRADQDRAQADPNVYQFKSKPVSVFDLKSFVTVCQARLKRFS